MLIKCTECEHGINIPDENIPEGQSFAIACPGCRAKIHIDRPLISKPPEETKPFVEGEPGDENGSGDDFGIIISDDFEDDEEEEFHIYDENDKLALILDEPNKTQWTEVLEEKGFKVQFAKSAAHAVHKMKFTHYHYVILRENYDNIPLMKNPVYQLLVKMPMATRRHIFLAVLGDKFKTLNNMQAFSVSANLVINEKDVDKLAKILKKAIAEHEVFYKVFKESLQAMGKS
jgi:spore coat polysaccharide biosynthesis predicted glycosyltransferase SpsG